MFIIGLQVRSVRVAPPRTGFSQGRGLVDVPNGPNPTQNAEAVRRRASRLPNSSRRSIPLTTTLRHARGSCLRSMHQKYGPESPLNDVAHTRVECISSYHIVNPLKSASRRGPPSRRRSDARRPRTPGRATRQTRGWVEEGEEKQSLSGLVARTAPRRGVESGRGSSPTQGPLRSGCLFSRRRCAGWCRPWK